MVSRGALPVTLAFCLALTCSAISFGQPPTDAWKNLSDRGNRWEGGDLPRPVSVLPLELVSFIAATEQPTITPNTALAADFYVTDPAAVRLYAHEINVVQHYFMEAKAPPGGWKKGWNTFGPWPTEMLSSLQIPKDNLGIVARFNSVDQNERDVTPVILRFADRPTAPLVDRYQATFRTGQRFTGGTYSILEGCGGATKLATGSIRQQRGGAAFPVSFTIKNRPASEVTLRVEMKTGGQKDQAAVVQEFCFTHVPQPSI